MVTENTQPSQLKFPQLITLDNSALYATNSPINHTHKQFQVQPACVCVYVCDCPSVMDHHGHHHHLKALLPLSLLSLLIFLSLYDCIYLHHRHHHSTPNCTHSHFIDNLGQNIHRLTGTISGHSSFISFTSAVAPLLLSHVREVSQQQQQQQ